MEFSIKKKIVSKSLNKEFNALNDAKAKHSVSLD